MNKIIQVLETTKDCSNFDEKTKRLSNHIIEFYNKLDEFNKKYNEKDIDKENFILLGRNLNDLRNLITFEIFSIMHRFPPVAKNAISLEDKIYVFTLALLPAFSEIPENYLITLLNTSRERIKTSTLEEFFSREFDCFSLWKQIYNENGSDGLAKYVALNNKIKSNMHCTFVDLYLDGVVSSKLIMNLTSPDNVLYKYKSSEQALIIKNYIKK